MVVAESRYLAEDAVDTIVDRRSNRCRRWSIASDALDDDAPIVHPDMESNLYGEMPERATNPELDAGARVGAGRA